MDVGDYWFMAPVTRRVVEFKKSLAMEPPIRLGTPDPHVPKNSLQKNAKDNQQIEKLKRENDDEIEKNS